MTDIPIEGVDFIRLGEPPAKGGKITFDVEPAWGPQGGPVRIYDGGGRLVATVGLGESVTFEAVVRRRPWWAFWRPETTTEWVRR